MNDYAGLAPAIVEGAGIEELSPVALPQLSRKGALVEIMPELCGLLVVDHAS